MKFIFTFICISEILFRYLYCNNANDFLKLKIMTIQINTFATYSEAVLTNVPANFTDAQQEALMNELNVDILVF